MRNFYSQTSMIGFQATGETYSRQKEHSELQNSKFLHLYLFCGVGHFVFLNPDPNPLIQLNPDLILIRILIRNTVLLLLL
jgi:hypothetical protein